MAKKKNPEYKSAEEIEAENKRFEQELGIDRNKPISDMNEKSFVQKPSVKKSEIDTSGIVNPDQPPIKVNWLVVEKEKTQEKEPASPDNVDPMFQKILQEQEQKKKEIEKHNEFFEDQKKKDESAVAEKQISEPNPESQLSEREIEIRKFFGLPLDNIVRMTPEQIAAMNEAEEAKKNKTIEAPEKAAQEITETASDIVQPAADERSDNPALDNNTPSVQENKNDMTILPRQNGFTDWNKLFLDI